MASQREDSMMDDLRQYYIKSFPQKMAALKQASETREFDALSRLGHQLKGSGMSYGFPDISRLGQELEDAALITEGTKVDMILAELEQIVRDLSGKSTSNEG
jgi:HPt (histidine-containing phosphotransfer) domain-containing protein